jgi:hypothetical protein
VLIVTGLAVSAPPSCLCASDEHFGLLLHPMVPHAHGAAHQAWQEEPAPADDAASALFDQAPGISAQSSDSGARDVIAGMLLPLQVAAMLVEVGRRRFLLEPQPDDRATSPPTPPPRLVPAVA